MCENEGPENLWRNQGLKRHLEAPVAHPDALTRRNAQALGRTIGGVGKPKIDRKWEHVKNICVFRSHTPSPVGRRIASRIPPGLH